MQERLKKASEEAETKKESTAAPPGEADAQTKEIMEHLEAQNRKLQGSFDAYKREIAELNAQVKSIDPLKE